MQLTKTKNQQEYNACRRQGPCAWVHVAANSYTPRARPCTMPRATPRSPTPVLVASLPPLAILYYIKDDDRLHVANSPKHVPSYAARPSIDPPNFHLPATGQNSNDQQQKQNPPALPRLPSGPGQLAVKRHVWLARAT